MVREYQTKERISGYNLGKNSCFSKQILELFINSFAFLFFPISIVYWNGLMISLIMWRYLSTIIKLIWDLKIAFCVISKIAERW